MHKLDLSRNSTKYNTEHCERYTSFLSLNRKRVLFKTGKNMKRCCIRVTYLPSVIIDL